MASPIESRVHQLLQSPPPPNWNPTTVTRELYLDFAEKLVRVAAAWQDENGAIIDPVLGEEWGQSSPRFLSPGAVLLQFGRVDDLREPIYRAMDWCCARLAAGAAKSPDFWMREMITAWTALQTQPVENARRERWEIQLRSIDPEKIYWQVSPDGSNIKNLHNWTVYAAAGEGLRQLAGLGPQDENIVWGAKFFQKYMPAQLAHFSAEGMYRDPNDPFTYDLTTRLQFATPLALGLKTPLHAELDDLLRRGALAQLLYVSPEGFAPFGGRSNQFHLQEAILAALGELEARRYKTENPALAGAFKRQARLSAASMRRWLDMEPHRHLKNGFAPATRHGCEDYAWYSVYSLFTASCLALAATFADETIEEAPMPIEMGGTILEIAPAFHKIFAVCGQTQIEIDTRADLHYDATGLGRFHRAHVPGELGLMMPFPTAPSFHLSDGLQPPTPFAIGPVWRDESQNWVSLAGLSEKLSSSLQIEREMTEEVAFEILWEHGATQIREKYRLREGRLRLEADVKNGAKPASVLRLTLPLLESDGATQSKITLHPNSATVEYRGALLRASWADNARANCDKRVANRNGIYRVLVLEWDGAQSAVELELHPCA